MKVVRPFVMLLTIGTILVGLLIGVRLLRSLLLAESCDRHLAVKVARSIQFDAVDRLWH